MRYFIGNWKMFGVPKSIHILTKINNFISKDKNRKKYKVIVAPPFTLLESYSKFFKKKKIIIASQNCYHKDFFSSNTGAISSYMLKSIGIKYVILGHSDNRSEGDSDIMLKNKVHFALKNNLKVVFCIGENKLEKRNKKTLNILRQQLNRVLENKFNKKDIIVAYEPIWSIGTGKLPSKQELTSITIYIKSILRKIFKNNIPPVLYGGSVDNSNIKFFEDIKVIDGFLIGGASKSSKKFIDIIKNYYR
ncbi:MAG: triose-phosphate isomerase [Pelagibacteraceae bacterium]